MHVVKKSEAAFWLQDNAVSTQLRNETMAELGRGRGRDLRGQSILWDWGKTIFPFTALPQSKGKQVGTGPGCADLLPLLASFFSS